MGKRMLMNKSKIVSRFYVIYGDDNPIYVGYTNRSINKRFSEHKRDKDFNDYSNVEVKEVDKQEFDFTWDIAQVNENAKQVSDRENELITEYSTGNSQYQKGLSDMKGGQTWASVKGFVNSNRNNPQYIGMGSEELLCYLDGYRKKHNKLAGFVNSYQDPKILNLRDFVARYQDPRVYKLSNFIARRRERRLYNLHMFITRYEDPKVTKLSGFIHSYQDPWVAKLRNFIGNYKIISNYKDFEILKLSKFIGSYQEPTLIKLKSFVSNYKDHKIYKLQGFIKVYQDPKVSKLQGFIGSYKDPKVAKLKNFIGNYQITEISKLHSFIGRYKN